MGEGTEGRPHTFETGDKGKDLGETGHSNVVSCLSGACLRWPRRLGEEEVLLPSEDCERSDMLLDRLSMVDNSSKMNEEACWNDNQANDGACSGASLALFLFFNCRVMK